MGNYSKSTINPTLKDVFDTVSMNIFDRLNCHTIGIIDSFDESNQTAEIQVVFKKTFENKEHEPPLLVDCPVIVLGGSAGGLRLPITKGDHCLVLFNDVNIDNWYEGAVNMIPESNRKHDLSDGIALVGIRNLQNAISGYDNEASLLHYGTTQIRLKDKIKLGNSTSDIKILFDNLIDAVKAIVTIGSPASHTLLPASQAALEAIKTQIAGVFE